MLVIWRLPCVTAGVMVNYQRKIIILFALQIPWFLDMLLVPRGQLVDWAQNLLLEVLGSNSGECITEMCVCVFDVLF